MTEAKQNGGPHASTGVVANGVIIPTFDIPCDRCQWVVVKAGPGRECLSQLRYVSGLCRGNHPVTQPQQEKAAVSA